MNLLDATKILNADVLALLGYVIVCNNQIHSFQLKEVNKFLKSMNMLSEAGKIMAVLDGKSEALTLSETLKLYSEEEEDVKRNIYWFCCVLARMDGIIDSEEYGLLSKIREHIGPFDYMQELEGTAKEYADQRRNEYIDVKEDTRQKPTGNIFIKYINFLLGILRKRFLKTNKNIPRISDEEYYGIIGKCGRIAEEDFRFLKPAYEALYNESIGVAEKIDKYRSTINLSDGKYAGESYKIISDFLEIFRNKVINQLTHAQQELLKKEHALTDYSIALIGRTKAGKTTLHSILTGEGKENIGIGMQRTTRYNRVYQWKHLRIIDTPGIGSAEAEGRTDDEIAESVIGEADIICFVVTDDSIQQDILDFLNRIAKRNKPVIILLNHKENIRNEIRFKRFIKDPDKWFNDKDGVAGHVKRIMRHASDNGYDRILSVYPVFLLAELMAGEDDYAKYKRQLHDSSKIDDFLYALRKKVIDSGTVSRSQTIIDDSIGFFYLWRNEIGKALLNIRDFKNQLVSRHKPAVNKLNRLKDDFGFKAKDFLEHQFDILANQETLKFAESNYREKRGLEGKWSNYLKAIRFEEKIADELNRYGNEFTAGVREVIEELVEDMEISVSRINADLSDITPGNDFSYKKWIGLFGGAIGLTGTILTVASIPVVGWILTGLGIVVSFISSLFKSREKKRQEAIENIQKQLKDSIDKNAPSYISKQIKSINENCLKAIDRIDCVFKELIEGFDDIETIINTLIERYDGTIDYLNRVYAWRIMNFIGADRQYDLQDIIGVERTYGNNMIIKVTDYGELKTDQLHGIFKENITVVKTEQ